MFVSRMGRWQCAVVVTVVLQLLHPVTGRSELAILNDIDASIKSIAHYLDLLEEEAITTTTQIVTTTTEFTTESSSTTGTTESTVTLTSHSSVATGSSTTGIESTSEALTTETSTTSKETSTTEAVTTSDEPTTTTNETAIEKTGQLALDIDDHEYVPLDAISELKKSALRAIRSSAEGTQKERLDAAIQTVTQVSLEISDGTINEGQVEQVGGAEQEVRRIYDDPHDELISDIQADPSLIDGWQKQVQASEGIVSSTKDASQNLQTIIIVSSVLGGVLLIVSVAFISFVIYVQKSKKKKPKQPNLANKQNVALEMTERGEELGVDNLAMAAGEPFGNGNNHPPPSSGIPESGNFVPDRDILRQSPAGIQSSNAATDADVRLSRFEVTGKKPMSTYGSPYDAPRDRSPPPRSQSRSRPSEYRDPPREPRVSEYPRAYPPPSRDHRPPPPRGSSHPQRTSSSNRPPSPTNRRRHESPRGPYDAPPRGYSQPRPAPGDYRDSRRPPSNYRSSNDMASPRAAPPTSKQPRPDRRDFRGPYGPEDLY